MEELVVDVVVVVDSRKMPSWFKTGRQNSVVADVSSMYSRYDEIEKKRDANMKPNG